MAFIHPAKLSSIQALELRVKTIVEGFLSGLHKSPFHGFSVEFSEYRNYNQGDSLRHLDWKIFAKTDRLMLKKFEADTNLFTHILLDVSASMNYSSGLVTKFEYAKNLSAAIIYLLIKQNDAVGLSIFSDDVNTVFKAKTGRSHLNNLLQEIERLKAKKTTDLETAIKKLGKIAQKKGLIVIFTDFIGEMAMVLPQLSYLQKYGHDVVLFHIFSDDEIEFGFKGRQVFIDMETNEQIDVTAELIKEKYIELSKKFLSDMRQLCLNRQIEYFRVRTSDFYEEHLFEFLNKRQKKY